MIRFRRSTTFAAALLVGVVAVAVLGASPQAGASTPPEFAAATTGCQGPPGIPSAAVPMLTVTLYNVPAGASPSGSGTMSSGTMSAPLNLIGTMPDTLAPSAWTLGIASLGPIAPTPASWGKPAFISVTWSDGLGGSGTNTQVVGIPTCQIISRQASAMASVPGGAFYWVATSDGRVFSQANSQRLWYGDMGYLPMNAPIVGMASRPDGQGYWLLGGDGGVFTFGLAQFYGSTGGLRLNAPVVGMAATPDGGGYWLVAKDGGVFAYGDAGFYGSMGGKPLNKPIVGMTVDQATGGYWLVASDGGVFSFNAPFYGSTGNLVLNQPVIGMEAAPGGSGYRLGASDGGVFSFNVPFAGSNAGGDPHPTVGITGDGNSGYWLLDNCGVVYPFGSAPLYGQNFVC